MKKKSLLSLKRKPKINHGDFDSSRCSSLVESFSEISFVNLKDPLVVSKMQKFDVFWACTARCLSR